MLTLEKGLRPKYNSGLCVLEQGKKKKKNLILIYDLKYL